jgi:putative transposase
MGLLLAVVVHSASVQDRDGAQLVLSKLWALFPRLQIIWADGGYAGELVYWCAYFGGWLLSIIRRTDKGFKVLPRRWVVERTFAWLNQYRRLSKDYEESTISSEAMIHLVMIQVMVRRIE